MLKIGEQAVIMAPPTETLPSLIPYIGTECIIVDFMINGDVLIRHFDKTYSIIPSEWLNKEFPLENWAKFCEKYKLPI